MPEFWAIYAAMLTGGVILILLLKRPWESEVSAGVLASICVLFVAQVVLVVMLGGQLAFFKAVLAISFVAGMAGIILAVTMPSAALYVVVSPALTAAVFLTGLVATAALLDRSSPDASGHPSR